MNKIVILLLLPALAFSQARNRETFDTIGGKLYRVRTVTIRQEMPDTLALFNEVQELRTLMDSTRAQLNRKNNDFREAKRLFAQLEKDRKKPKGNREAGVSPVVAPVQHPQPTPKKSKKSKKSKKQ